MQTMLTLPAFEPRPWRFDATAYHAIGAIGLFGSGQGVELLDGRIYDRGRPKVWTREEFYRLGEAGLFGDRRVELIDGEIIEMTPVNEPHSIALTLMHELLAARIPAGWHIRNQMPLAVAGRRPSDPLPDLAVIDGRPRDYPTEPPAWARLIIEISDSSLDYDQADKLRLYAAAGVAAYWVVDLNGRVLHVYSVPQADGYGTHATVGEGDAVALPWPAAPVHVADLLP